MCGSLRMHTIVRRRSTVTHRAGEKEPTETVARHRWWD